MVHFLGHHDMSLTYPQLLFPLLQALSCAISCFWEAVYTGDFSRNPGSHLMPLRRSANSLSLLPTQIRYPEHFYFLFLTIFSDSLSGIEMPTAMNGYPGLFQSLI